MENSYTKVKLVYIIDCRVGSNLFTVTLKVSPLIICIGEISSPK